MKADIITIYDLLREAICQMINDPEIIKTKDQRTMQGVHLLGEATQNLYAACINLDLIGKPIPSDKIGRSIDWLLTTLTAERRVSMMKHDNQPAQRTWEPYTGDLQSACSPQRLLKIKKRLNEIPHIWNSGYKQHYRPGDCVIGIFSRFNKGRAVIITETGNTEVSLDWRLEDEFSRQDIWPGDLIGIKYLGRHKGPYARSQDEFVMITDNMHYLSSSNGPVAVQPTGAYDGIETDNHLNGEWQ